MAYQTDLNENDPSSGFQSGEEFPKMLYLHPVDKTEEHKTMVVNDADQEDAAKADGWKVEPHIPEVSPAKQYEGKEVVESPETPEFPEGEQMPEAHEDNTQGPPPQEIKAQNELNAQLDEHHN